MMAAPGPGDGPWEPIVTHAARRVVAVRAPEAVEPKDGPNADPRQARRLRPGLTGEIIARFERKGLKIVALRAMTVSRELAERHYAEHAERPFFGELVDFITSGPIVAMVLEGQTRSRRRGR